MYVIGAHVSSEDCTTFQELIAIVSAMQMNATNVHWILETQTSSASRASQTSFRKWDVHFDTSMSAFVGVVSYEQVPFRKAQVEAAITLLRDQAPPGSRRYNAQVYVCTGPPYTSIGSLWYTKTLLLVYIYIYRTLTALRI